MKLKNPILFSCLVILVLLSFSVISAAEFKAVKVSELREGDVIIDKSGNEIVVSSLEKTTKEMTTLSELIIGKADDETLDQKKVYSSQLIAGAGTTGYGIVENNFLDEGDNTSPGILTRFFSKIKSLFTNK